MKQRKVDNLRFYEIDSGYIEYLSKYAPHLYRNSKDTQQNERKYIGIVLKVNNLNYLHKESDSLSKRCNDYLLLEEKCKAYKE